MVERCVVHPARPAGDACPVCDRPRCAPDAEAAPGGGCLACRGVRPGTPAGPRPLTARSVVGAAVVCHLVAIFGGAVVSQYVEVRWFAVVAPAGAGVAIGIAADWGARAARGRPILGIAVGYALLATALGFRFEPAGVEPLDALRTVGMPYLVAVLGALGGYAWTAPPKPRKPKAG